MSAIRQVYQIRQESAIELLEAADEAFRLLIKLRGSRKVSDAPEITKLGAILIFIRESIDYRCGDINAQKDTCACGHKRENHWHGCLPAWTFCGISDCSCGMFTAISDRCVRHNTYLNENHECALCVAEDNLGC